MNKTLLKNFATAARVRLMDDVRYRLGLMGITAGGIAAPTHQSLDMEAYEYAKGQTYRLTGPDVAARRNLADMVLARGANGFEQVVEEVAYTWFNRLIAIRFMEVNDYLPHHTRVLSSATPGQTLPDIITRALDIDLGLTAQEKQQVLEWKLSNQTDELFRFLFLKQCRQLAGLLPGLFGADNAHNGPKSSLIIHPSSLALLLTISCVNPEGILAQLLKIPESYFNVNLVDEDGQPTGQVEIIGWLYQYYIDEKRDQVINIFKGTVKKDDIPAATQLFTTEWVVKYMVENSLGRTWLESHPDEALAAKWKYYMRTDSSEQGAAGSGPPDGNLNSSLIPHPSSLQSPEELKVLDPCVGSGHILVYAFDVLMDIYTSVGYLARDAARLIVETNLYGLDIDKRAAQLAYFAVMMKGRQHDRDFLSRAIRPHVHEIYESNGLEALGGLPGQLRLSARGVELAGELIACYRDAKVYGSLIQANHLDLSGLDSLMEDLLEESTRDLTLSGWLEQARALLPHFASQTRLLTGRYHAVVTNPPYLNKYNDALKSFVRAVYKEYSADLFSCFMYRNFDFCLPGGYAAFMTPNVWMFIKSYERLRDYIIHDKQIASLIQIAKGAFYREATVDVCTFVFKNDKPNQKGIYLRLEDFKGNMALQEQKVLEAQGNSACSYRYLVHQLGFTQIPGAPVAYWAGEALLKAFETGRRMDSLVDPRQGLATADNDRFIRQWYEVEIDKASFDAANATEAVQSGKKWFPYNKGGERRQWYGNYDYLVNWENDGDEIRNFKDANGKVRSRPQNTGYYFREAITWSDITSGGFSIRYRLAGGLHDVTGMSAFSMEHGKLMYLLALMSTHLADCVFKMVNPTIHLQIGNFSSFPVLQSKAIENQVIALAEACVELARADWDAFETSWDFQVHPLIGVALQRARIYEGSTTIAHCFAAWERQCEERFQGVKRREEELNRIFIDLYGLQQELSPKVAEKDITIRRADQKRDICSLLSYAVGCMFGRYHIKDWGLQFAGGDWAAFSQDKVQDINNDDGKFSVDADNILPITDEEYFADDIVEKLVDFVRIAFGRDTVEENLRFIADSLGGSGSPREVIRSYFLKDFYKDHVRTYKKRPIYWLFDSGKQNGFKALIYLHRYDRDTLGRVRVDYLHRLQGMYENAIGSCDNLLASAISAAEKGRTTKRKEKLQRQLEECKIYDQALAHLANQRIQIDLDDGVKHNYALFQGVELAREGRRAVKVNLLGSI